MEAPLSGLAVEQQEAQPQPQPQPAAGPELGWRTDFASQYCLGQRLGRGSYGTVHLGIHHKSGLQAAVKTLPKVHGKWSREKTLSRIAHETSVLEQLQGVHGVVRTLGFFEDAEDVHIVTEVCWGGDLQAFALRRGCLDEASLARVAYEVLRIIEGFHDAGYMHGDVKPGNFVVTVPCRDLATDLPLGGIRAVDVGCARRLGEGERLMQRAGTPAFMAPEVYAGSFAHKADIWAVGVMLFWLFDGTYPFAEQVDDLQRASLDDIAAAVTCCAPSFTSAEWHAMSQDGLDFVRACLCRDEACRVDAKAALSHPWIQRLGMPTEPPGVAMASLDDDFFE